MKLYFVRHGESIANTLHVFSNGDAYYPLTEKGIQQAESLAADLTGQLIDRIYSSLVIRAAQTAIILSERLAAPLQMTEALREWSVGIYDGKNDPAGWDLFARVQDQWFSHQQYDARMPGGESFHDIHKRFVPFIEGLVSDELNSDRTILLVSHGGLYMAMLPVIFKNIDIDFARQHHFPNTSYALAETRPDGLYCLEWCGQQIT